ncbi:MAG: hypothetical protein WCP93_04075 [Candidatus Berkelbacteria bacterium]
MRTLTTSCFLVAIFILALPILAKDINLRASFQFGYDGTNPQDAPAAVVAEGLNPTITNPHSGNSFDKTKIGTFDANDFGSGSFASFFGPNLRLEAALIKETSPYIAVRIPLNSGFDSIHGNTGESYSYSKVLGGGADYVRYIYGAECKSAVSPEIGVRWTNTDFYDSQQELVGAYSVGLEFRKQNTTFYKGLEAYGKPEGLVPLAQVGNSTTLLHGRYENQAFGVDLTLPVSKGGNFALNIVMSLSNVWDTLSEK